MAKKKCMSPEEMQTKILEIHEGINFIRSGIRVNGQQGLEPILTESYKNIKELKDRTTFLEKITAKTRSSYELWGAIQKWAEQHKLAAMIFKMFLNKTTFRLFMVILGILCVALFGDRVIALLNKLYRIFK